MNDEKTPGRAAYEAMSQAAADFEDCTDLDIMSGWDALSSEHQAAIEAGAQRVLSGGYPHVAQQFADRDHLEHELAAATRQAQDLSALVDELEAKLAVVTRERNDALRAQVNGVCCDRGGRIRELETKLADLDQSAELARRLERVAESHARVMYAAFIDVRHGDPNDVDEMLAEQLDGFEPGDDWNGTETGIQWLERTRAAQERQ
jgi:hypothetical protein